MGNYEPCSICEEYIEGVICDKDKCPVEIMKKEIERLKKLALARHLHIEHLNADIRELKETRYSQVKAEAYKDLAEKLKAKKQRAYIEEEGFLWCVSVEDIDEVLKEVANDGEF